MKQQTYTIVSGLLFALIAIIHLLRALSGWGATLNGWSAPMWMSWVAVIITGVLAVNAFLLAGR
ncbi:hypothetical protein HY213_03530 [Candidatus Peregrinibacteria bacterium]|nr:hypothetical protein [Candidatus Peregrinibacteria bacterium]